MAKIAEYRRAPETSKALVPIKRINPENVPSWLTEVPVSRSQVRQQKKWWSKKFKTDATAKRKKYANEIKYKLSQIRKTKATAKAKIRDKHADVEGVYSKHHAHGGRWTEFSKKVPWKRPKGRPLGSKTQRRIATSSYTDGEVVDQTVDSYQPGSNNAQPSVYTPRVEITTGVAPIQDPRRLLGYTDEPFTRKLLAAPSRSFHATMKKLPQAFIPRALLPVGQPKETPRESPHLLPVPNIDQMRRVGLGAEPIALPPGVRGLLPAPRSMRSRMQSIMNKLSTATG